MKVVSAADCANSPKNAFAERVAVLVLTKARPQLETLVAEGFTAELASRGKQASLTQLLDDVPDQDKDASLTVGLAITHGKSGAVEGEVSDESSGKVLFRFCLVMQFETAKAARLASLRLYLSN